MRNPLALITLTFAVLAPVAPSEAQEAADTAAARRAPRPVVTGRSMVITKLGVVASSNPLAARAGVQILENGGNAIDATIAASAVIGLVEPASNGIGGDLFALIYTAKDGTLHGLNASGWAASGMTPEFLASKEITRMPGRGVYAVTVPGVVAGWQAMQDRFGQLKFETTLAPAIYYAEQGFPVTEIVAGLWRNGARNLATNPNSNETFLPKGRAPVEGEIFRNPDLGRSLRRIVAKGRDGFYKGETADAIVGLLRENGGTMTLADLADFQPEWQTPISTTYRGWTVYEMPPQGSGIAALMMLNLMEQFPLKEWGFHSTRTMHTMIEAKKLAYADMLQYVGDPRSGSIPVQQLLSKTRAAERATLINPTTAACTMTPGKLDGITDSEGSETIYFSVVDKDGNMVSLIQSIYSEWGSGLVPKGTGIMLHNRGGLFTLTPNQPNTLAPRKRPLHTIIPAMMEKDGVRIGFGIMGGWNQSQAHAQFVADIADYGFTIQEALEAGRFTKSSFQGCDVSVEHLVPERVRTELTALGHRITVPRPRSGTFGWGQAVMTDTAKVHYGASEPRHDGGAIPEAPDVLPKANWLKRLFGGGK
jgi:gamma-glutamyltranspeptidase/glutathione hydrolase